MEEFAEPTWIVFSDGRRIPYPEWVAESKIMPPRLTLDPERLLDWLQKRIDEGRI